MAPPVLPTVFADRSLGRYEVPRLLRAAGLAVVTMAEHYGEQTGQRTPDPDWISEVATRGWVGFCKDSAIQRRTVERRAVLAAGALLFVVPNANLRAAQVAARFIRNLEAIALAGQARGPAIYRVLDTRIERLRLD